MLIWGWRRTIQELLMLTLVCGNCNNPSAHALRRAVTKFTLFFIPLFPISSKYFVQCTFCGASADIGKQEAQQMQAQAAPQPAAPGPQTGPQPTGPHTGPQQYAASAQQPMPGQPMGQPGPGYPPAGQQPPYPNGQQPYSRS